MMRAIIFGPIERWVDAIEAFVKRFPQLPNINAVIFECGHVVAFRDVEKGEDIFIMKDVFFRGECPACQGIIEIPEGERIMTEQDLLNINIVGGT